MKKIFSSSWHPSLYEPLFMTQKSSHERGLRRVSADLNLCAECKHSPILKMKNRGIHVSIYLSVFSDNRRVRIVAPSLSGREAGSSEAMRIASVQSRFDC
jgi:hypothetical protein